jgi:hypothetical protein
VHNFHYVKFDHTWLQSVIDQMVRTLTSYSGDLGWLEDVRDLPQFLQANNENYTPVFLQGNIYWWNQL